MIYKQNQDQSLIDEEKALRISDSTLHTESDQINEEALFDIFLAVDQKRNKIKQLMTAKVQQKSLNRENISKFVDWLLGTFWRFDLEDETILFSLGITQIYLKNKVIQIQKLQRLGLVCMYIASKYFQVKKLQMSDLLPLLYESSCSDDLIQIQSEVLILLNFDLEIPSFYKYFQVIQIEKHLNADQKNKTLFWIQVYFLKNFLNDIEQKQIVIEIISFVLNPKQKSKMVCDLIDFVIKTRYKYVVKKYLSRFDIESYLLQIQNH